VYIAIEVRNGKRVVKTTIVLFERIVGKRIIDSISVNSNICIYHLTCLRKERL